MDNQPQQQVRESNRLFLIFGALFFLSIGFMGGYILRGYTFPKQQIQKNIPVLSPTIQPSPPEKSIDMNVYNMSEEIGDFPVYPQSLFTDKTYYNPCPGEEISGYSFTCDTVTYTWQTRDDFEKVINFYQKDTSQSGWTCPSGGGQVGGGVLFCRKGDGTRKLHVYSDEIKTEIMLEIPFKEYKGKFF